LKNKEKYDVSYISAILDIEREKNAIILNEKFKNSKHFFHFFKPFNVLNSEHESQNIFTNAFLKQEKTICI
jgi:c-di-GMP-binding flagellar brake protein YcgR